MARQAKRIASTKRRAPGSFWSVILALGCVAGVSLVQPHWGSRLEGGGLAGAGGGGVTQAALSSKGTGVFFSSDGTPNGTKLELLEEQIPAHCNAEPSADYEG